MKAFYGLPYRDALALDLYLPDAESFPLFVYFHGGGLEGGDKARHVEFAKELLDANVAFASVNYRMYPNAKYPDFLTDAADAIAYLKEHIGEYGKCEGIYVGGSSAGGYLSMMLCFDESILARVGMKPTEIAGWVHDSGQPTKHYNVCREAGIDTRRVLIDETAPLYHVGTNAQTPSRMLFLVADDDMKNRYEQTVLMMSTLRHFGIGEDVAALRLMHGTHCAHVSTVTPEGKYLFGEIIRDFIKGETGKTDR